MIRIALIAAALALAAPATASAQTIKDAVRASNRYLDRRGDRVGWGVIFTYDMVRRRDCARTLDGVRCALHWLKDADDESTCYVDGSTASCDVSTGILALPLRGWLTVDERGAYFTPIAGTIRHV